MLNHLGKVRFLCASFADRSLFFQDNVYPHFPTVRSEDIPLLGNLQTKGKFVFLVLFPSELEFITAKVALSGKYTSTLCH